MNIIRFLKDQHDEVNALLDELIVGTERSDTHSMLEMMSKALRLHMLIEETIVYPVTSRCFEGDPRKPSVLESYEAHAVAKQVLSALESTPSHDARFVARAKALKAILREHILDEESELFPALATKLGQSGIDMLGNEVEHQLSQLEAESAPRRAKRAATKPTKSRTVKAARTKRPRAAGRGTKRVGSRKKSSSSKSARRH
jgi:iron-sulfur cluster repair protein YtfE (RIC family)